MQIDQILYHINNTPSLKLLRHDQGALAAGFLHFAFKQTSRLQIPYQDLAQLLESYMADLDSGLAINLKLTARQYLDLWANDDHRFLRKYYEVESDEPVTELTHDTEQALEWLQSLEKKEFVGARSRFYAIFENLGFIAVQGDQNPKERLAHLARERDRIEKEMREIKRSGKVSHLDRVEIKERFLHVMEDSRRIIGEFRLIEDIFKDLTRQIKEQKLRAGTSKGAIVGQVLDIHDYLEESDQGKSFRSFWNFLMSSEKQSELKELTAKVLAIDEIREISSQQAYRSLPQNLLTLKSQLLQVGHKVLKSQYRLSKELRKLLHQEALAENKKVHHEIFEIKRLCLLHREDLSSCLSETLLDLDLTPEIRLPLERPLWRPKKDIAFMPATMLKPGQARGNQGWDLLAAAQDAVRRRELEERIHGLLERQEAVTLPEIVAKYPVNKGCSELVAYLAIAAASEEHSIDATRRDRLEFSSTNGRGSLDMPRVTFGRMKRDLPELSRVSL